MTLAEIVAPYGVVAPDIIDPASFQELSERLLASAPAPEDLNELVADCQEIIERFVDDEPADGGFYAFGAVVSMFYACWRCAAT